MVMISPTDVTHLLLPSWTKYRNCLMTTRWLDYHFGSRIRVLKEDRSITVDHQLTPWKPDIGQERNIKVIALNNSERHGQADERIPFYHNRLWKNHLLCTLWLLQSQRLSSQKIVCRHGEIFFSFLFELDDRSMIRLPPSKRWGI